MVLIYTTKLSLQVMKILQEKTTDNLLFTIIRKFSKYVFASGLIFLSLVLLSSCASQKTVGLRKSKKRNCDCPSFTQLNDHQAPLQSYLISNYGKSRD
jgi:hypothetical protein